MKTERVEVPSKYFLKYQSIAAIHILFLLVVAGHGSAAEKVLNSPALNKLAMEALQNNEELQSRAENVRALKAEIPFAGSLENPRLGLGLANIPTDTFDLDQEQMTQKQIFISQKFPWFGKLELSQRIAGLDAARADALLRANQLKVIRKLCQTWFDLNFVGHSLTTNGRLQELLTQILRIAETRYATGSGLQQDILAAQVELSKLINEHVDLQSRERSLLASIGEILHRKDFYRKQSQPGMPPELELSMNIEELTQKAHANNPVLLADSIAEERARLKVLLAEKDYGPDMDVRLSYGQREDNPVTGSGRADFFSATVSFSLPLWQSTRQDSKLLAMERRQSAAEKKIDSFKNTLPHRIEAIVAEITAAQENARLLEDALTLQAEQLAEASLASYSVGKVDFDTMLKSRINTLRFALQAQKYRYTALKKSAELNELAGEPAELIKDYFIQAEIQYKESEK